MSLGNRLKTLRQEIGLSQEAIGAQGFVSAPGYIKIENGQRSPSDTLIVKLVDWLAASKHIQNRAMTALREELLLRKYLGHSRPYVRKLARAEAATTDWGKAILAEETIVAASKGKLGRPVATGKGKGGRK